MLQSILSKSYDYATGAAWLAKVYVKHSVLRMASTHTHSQVVKHGDSFTVTILPALEDNFMYLITDKATNEAAIVDPADPENVKRELDKSGQTLKTVLTTHHHWDHAGGNATIAATYPEVIIVGGDDRVTSVNRIVREDSLQIGKTKVKCIFTPCHTSGHICYFVTGADGQTPAVFTGDTLFLSGCGKFFEGTGEQMYDNLINKLGKLPDETKVYCGHEYSIQNLKFAQSVDPSNDHVKQKLECAKTRRDDKMPVPPSTIAEEKQYNPFMRVESAAKMQEMRERKNNFK